MAHPIRTALWFIILIMPYRTGAKYRTRKTYRPRRPRYSRRFKRKVYRKPKYSKKKNPISYAMKRLKASIALNAKVRAQKIEKLLSGELQLPAASPVSPK